MRRELSWLCYLYGWLLCLYPRPYRALFADEMAAVFAQALVDAAAQGWVAVLTRCCREVRDLPRLLLAEYWLLFRHWLNGQLQRSEPLRSDLPGLVPVGYGSALHLLFAVMGRNPRLRRLFDLLFALCGLVVAAPFLLILPVLIKLDSPGPILYRHQRIGKEGRLYTMYKFRSMQVKPPELGVSSTADRQLTRIGRWARRWYLDEVPQLFNVLKGEMSIFGPRPGMPQR